MGPYATLLAWEDASIEAYYNGNTSQWQSDQKGTLEVEFNVGP